jgi:DNA-binding LacI/PurR family transcriptional regulator
LKNNGINIEQDLVFPDCNSSVFVEQAVHYILKRKAECIVCTDDVICGRVLSLLREEGYSVPGDIKVASFYDSVYMKSNNPPVTAIEFNAEELGTIAGKRLIGLIEGDSNTSKTVLDYEIHLRRSTK